MSIIVGKIKEKDVTTTKNTSFSLSALKGVRRWDWAVAVGSSSSQYFVYLPQ